MQNGEPQRVVMQFLLWRNLVCLSKQKKLMYLNYIIYLILKISHYVLYHTHIYIYWLHSSNIYPLNHIPPQSYKRYPIETKHIISLFVEICYFFFSFDNLYFNFSFGDENKWGSTYQIAPYAFNVHALYPHNHHIHIHNNKMHVSFHFL